jgi:transposase-like protein
VHRARNILAKVPARAQHEVKAAYWAMFDIPADMPPGEKAESLIQQRITAFAVTHNKAYPAAVRCLQADRQALTVYLRFPREHWHRIRHSNFIERTFGETRRRVKVIGRLPGETSCVSLASGPCSTGPPRGWRGFTSPPPEPDFYKTCAAKSSTHPPGYSDTPPNLNATAAAAA